MPDIRQTNTAQDIPKTTEQEKQKKIPAGFRLYLMFGAVIGALLLVYFLVGLHYRNVFFPSTIVNGINVSGLTPPQVQDLLNAEAAAYILTIKEDGEKSEQIFGSEIGLYVRNESTLQDILQNQNILTWPFQIFQPKEYSLEISHDEEKFLSAANALSCMDKKNWIPPQDAYITYEKEGGYKIVPELPGSELLTDDFFEAARTAVDHMEDILSLREAGVYRSPNILADNADLAEQFALLQPYSDMSVTYLFGDQTEVLESDTIAEWISLNKSGKLTIDEEAATEFIKELAKKYNTAYMSKTLETSYGETVTVKGGFYGWHIDKAAELEELLNVIRDGKSVSKEPVYLLRAASHGETDYGDTYVEINLTAQHLFYYKDGELLIESDFVSGNPAKGNATPAGAYAITYTERNATLKGQNYRTPVSYWMPFNANIGMHDSTWRSSFGGRIYQTNGSHGCINLPPAVAKTIFENIEKGVPVLCYHLEGTEQKPASEDHSDTDPSDDNAPDESVDDNTFAADVSSNDVSSNDIPADGQASQE